jgi:LPPG:FO 2-phospho-L-lactate transferase
MKVAVLAGGVGGGKFLRGMVRAVAPTDVTAIVNTGDDLWLHGLRVCPDLDSVTYWLGDAFDRDRGWGRRDESFRTNKELARFDPERAWFGLGDLDLATHLFRTALLRDGHRLTEATSRVARRFGIETRILPMSDDEVTTRIQTVSDGEELDLDFQRYWVERGGRDDVKAVRFEGIDRARPSPGCLQALEDADAIVFAPSNPVVSIGPILAIQDIREAIASRRERAVGVSGIVGGSPLSGMADRLMPAAGLEVTAAGAASAYRGLLSGWVIDGIDAPMAARIERESEMRVTATDTLMHADDTAQRVATAALALATA